MQDVVKNIEKTVDGYSIACIWKWARQFKNATIKKPLKLEFITAKTIYKQHQNSFDKVAEAFSKSNSSPKEYVYFVAVNKNVKTNEVDNFLASSRMLLEFETWKNSIAKKKKIYSWFMKSVNNIVDACIENNLFTTKDLIRSLIESKKLGNWYASGKISKYYFAAIPNFWKIIPKLDHFSRLELKPIADRYDLYNSEVNEAFLHLKKFKVNPIALTDALIYEKHHGIRQEDGYLKKNHLI